MTNNSHAPYREIADNYDEEVKAYGSYAHDVIFGLCYQFITPGEKLLDIGIGTGLASQNFSRVGLRIFGVDSSEKMLEVCRNKAFTEELTPCDISTDPVPYTPDSFNHVICCGVLHFFGDLSEIFSETTRVLTNGGIFAFSIAPTETGVDYAEEPTSWGIPIFKHSYQYIQKLLEASDLQRVKEQRIVIKGEDKTRYNMEFSVIVCKYQK